MKALAIDIGGTHATCAIVEDRKILVSKHLDLDSAQGLITVLPLFVSTLNDLLRDAGLAVKDCAGLAVSSCGLVDSTRGKILSSPQKWEDAQGLDLNAWCQREFAIPFRIENDARMALLGEWYAGVGQGYTELVMFTLGTGIGGAVMMGGKLLHGKHSQAGNLGGHQPILFNGRQCMCGNIGCAEAEAAGWSVPLVAKDWPGFQNSRLSKEPQVNFEALFRLADQGDAVSQEIKDRCLHIWAAAAVGSVHAFDPELIIFGGGVMKSAAQIIPFIQDWVIAHSWAPWGKVQVRAAALGNDAGLLGAIPLLQS
jgi:glucokinase